MERIQKSSMRMKVFIEDLLELSQVSAKPKNYYLVSLSTVVAEVLSDLELKIKEKKAKVIIHSLPEIMGDKLQMRQLFQNLLSNALKFQRKEIPVEIIISSQRGERGHWRILLQDNGIGIAPENIDRIFKPFERLHGRSTYEGTGIGLAICKNIAQRHHGTIAVENIASPGACFTINLPERQPVQS